MGHPTQQTQRTPLLESIVVGALSMLPVFALGCLVAAAWIMHIGFGLAALGIALLVVDWLREGRRKSVQEELEGAIAPVHELRAAQPRIPQKGVQAGSSIDRLTRNRNWDVEKAEREKMAAALTEGTED